MTVIRLRAHHLLCMQFFEGKGYDQAFTENLWSIIRHTEKDPSVTIALVPGCDDVCDACPNKRGEGCTFGGSVLRKDSSAMRFLGIGHGTQMSAGELMVYVKGRLSTVSDMSEVCSECDWSGICNAHLLQMR